MSRQPTLYSPKALHQWTDDPADAFPQLSQPQVLGLATWSFGMILARCRALTTVALFLAQFLAQKYHAVRQRLREFYQEAAAKKGDRRRDLDVTTCFAPLLRWLLRDWDGRQCAVALDASTLGALFTVLCVIVMYRACAIPRACALVPAHAKGSSKDPWLNLLR